MPILVLGGGVFSDAAAPAQTRGGARGGAEGCAEHGGTPVFVLKTSLLWPEPSGTGCRRTSWRIVGTVPSATEIPAPHRRRLHAACGLSLPSGSPLDSDHPQACFNNTCLHHSCWRPQSATGQPMDRTTTGPLNVNAYGRTLSCDTEDHGQGRLLLHLTILAASWPDACGAIHLRRCSGDLWPMLRPCGPCGAAGRFRRCC